MKTTTNSAFPIFSVESPNLLYRNLPKPLLDALRMREKQKYADLLSEVLCACAKDTQQKTRRENRRCVAASQVDLQNQGAIFKNLSCTRESIAESIDRAPANQSPVKRRRFQTFEKVYHEYTMVTIDEKGDTCMDSEVRSTVVK